MKTLQERGHRSEANALASDALTRCEASGPDWAEERDEVRAWIVAN